MFLQKEKGRAIAKILSRYGEINVVYSSFSFTCYNFMGYFLEIYDDRLLAFEEKGCIKIFTFTKFTKKDAEEVFLFLYSHSLENDRTC